MEVKEIINKITSIEEEIYNYITNTEHWLFYWIANKEVQDFIKEYPEDYDDKVHLQVPPFPHIGGGGGIKPL